MKHVLSIQSHVSYGYVGNKAAVFPLQLLGLEAHSVNTVQFSNHTGYGDWTGKIFSSDHIQDLLEGLKKRGLWPKIDAILTGYMGDKTLGDIVLKAVAEIKEENPEALYCCDPVMGDIGRGFFVNESLPPFFADHASIKADILTPNLFELQHLASQDIHTSADAIKACHTLHNKGVNTVLVTSLQTQDTPEDKISMLLSLKDKTCHIISTPVIDFKTPPNGSGDLTAALFLGRYLQSNDPVAALEKTAASIYAIMHTTKGSGNRELQLIQAQDSILNPPREFKALEHLGQAAI